MRGGTLVGEVASARARERMHLAPLSPAKRRIWEIGVPPRAATRQLPLAVRPGDHRSFASLAGIVDQLRPRSRASQAGALDKVERYIDEATPDGPGHGGFLSHAVAFAVLRRISRESVYTARLIDHAARTLNDVLAGLPVDRVLIPDAERLDRPTLKVLGRATLLAGPSDGFAWVWSFGGLPCDDRDGDLLAAARSKLIQQLARMLSPTIASGSEAAGPAPRPEAKSSPTADRLVYDLAAALVVQNYDACFAWGRTVLPTGSTAGESLAVETRRLMAIAAVNTGRADAALRLLEEAEAGCRDRNRVAHLCYLQGLIEAKRAYDVAASDAHYSRGLAALDGDAPGHDAALERAWLFNGLALNRAIVWRREPSFGALYDEAFRLVNEAFHLVREGTSESHVYLRFNLVANAAFLLEMKGRYDLAIDVLGRAFDFGPGSPTEVPAGEVALSYRIGVLQHRQGDHKRALKLLHDAYAVEDASPEGWPTRERLLRAIGAVAFADDQHDSAEAAFREGLALCRSSRSACGTAEHARGLAATLLVQRRRAEAEELVDALEHEEAVSIELPEAGGERAAPRAPNPKLPPYFPELDLEEAPGIDLNRYLSAPEPAITHWRS